MAFAPAIKVRAKRIPKLKLKSILGALLLVAHLIGSVTAANVSNSLFKRFDENPSTQFTMIAKRAGVAPR
jgi:hypothetical protein